jgi:TonB family protein
MKKKENTMDRNYFKYALILLAVWVLLSPAAVGASDDNGDILVHLRLYEGSRGNEVQESSVVSSYYLKPLFISSMVSELDIREEQKELKRIFNLSDIKLMVRTQLGWKYARERKTFPMVVLNGHEFLVRLTLKGREDGFKVEVINQGGENPEALLETEVELPQEKSTVFGFEDSLRKPFFICLQREENQSVIDKEPPQLSFDRPRLLERVKPVYPGAALRDKIQGEVILDAAADETGKVEELYVVDGRPELARAAVQAVKQWRYEPYIKNGKAIPVRFTVIIHFNLPASAAEQGETGGIPPYGGEPMDFHFENADLMAVLKVIARRNRDINIVVDPGIEARVSCKLTQTPWDQALSWMLQLNGLDMIVNGNVVRILKAGPGNKDLKREARSKKYTGATMNFNFHNADLKDILKIISRVGGVEIEVQPGVEGRVTCKLENVHWDQFLDLVLQVNGLEMKRKGSRVQVYRTGKKPAGHQTESAGIPGILPVKGYLSDVFGFRKHPITGKRQFHNGIDIAAKRGTEVVASADGVVAAAEYRDNYGNLVIIDHNNGCTSWYARLSAFKVKKGDKVPRGQVIGYVGNTGIKSRPHLHYEVRQENKPVNPLSLMSPGKEKMKPGHKTD